VAGGGLMYVSDGQIVLSCGDGVTNFSAHWDKKRSRENTERSSTDDSMEGGS
jgi:hypothetical protein